MNRAILPRAEKKGSLCQSCGSLSSFDGGKRKNNSKWNKGRKHTEDSKKQMSSSQKKIWTQEKKNELSEKYKCENNPFYGKKHTKKSKMKMSKSKTGSKNPFYGRKHTEEWKEDRRIRFSGQNHPMYGKRFSVEQKEKIKKAALKNRECHGKLTFEMAEQIRQDYIPRVVTRNSLAKKYNVHMGTIDKILSYRIWKKIGD